VDNSVDNSLGAAIGVLSIHLWLVDSKTAPGAFTAVRRKAYLKAVFDAKIAQFCCFYTTKTVAKKQQKMWFFYNTLYSRVLFSDT
jgi:hypothetical protein